MKGCKCSIQLYLSLVCTLVVSKGGFEVLRQLGGGGGKREEVVFQSCDFEQWTMYPDGVDGRSITVSLRGGKGQGAVGGGGLQTVASCHAFLSVLWTVPSQDKAV